MSYLLLFMYFNVAKVGLCLFPAVVWCARMLTYVVFLCAMCRVFFLSAVNFARFMCRHYVVWVGFATLLFHKEGLSLDVSHFTFLSCRGARVGLGLRGITRPCAKDVHPLARIILLGNIQEQTCCVVTPLTATILCGHTQLFFP